MTVRPELGDFSSIVCFKYALTGIEDTLGTDGAAVAFIRAGKLRGHQLAGSLGVTGSKAPVEKLADMLNGAIGKEGTRLCVVKSVTQQGEDIVVETAETIESAGEPAGSDRNCTFTLGAVWGAIEAIEGVTYLGEQTESVLRGGASDKFVFSPL